MPSPNSVSSESSPAPRSIRFLYAASPMAIWAVTCAADWMHSPFPRWPSASGRSTSFPAASLPERRIQLTPMHQRRDLRKVVELCMVSNFVEVYLAREDHKNPVGINFLEKVQMPHLASIYGAMLAGVGYVLMGAGIPLHIPGVLDAFAAHHAAEYKLAVTGAAQEPGHADALRSGRLCGGSASAAASASLSGHRLLQHAGHHHAAAGQRPRGRIGDRKPDGGRTQCAAARQTAAQLSPENRSMASGTR